MPTPAGRLRRGPRLNRHGQDCEALQQTHALAPQALPEQDRWHDYRRRDQPQRWRDPELGWPAEASESGTKCRCEVSIAGDCPRPGQTGSGADRGNICNHGTSALIAVAGRTKQSGAFARTVDDAAPIEKRPARRRGGAQRFRGKVTAASLRRQRALAGYGSASVLCSVPLPTYRPQHSRHHGCCGRFVSRRQPGIDSRPHSAATKQAFQRGRAR
jgi:hypothetical protein